jgi:hypothetical protein
MEDLHDQMQKLELGPSVPQRIREQFDIARNAFVYSWFVYELVTLAERQSYTALEMALRERIEAAGGAPPRARGLKTLYELAFDKQFLQREAFDVPTPSGETFSQLEVIRMLRNRLSHEEMHLFPQGSLQMIQLCAEIIAELYPAEPKTAGDER